MCITSSRSILDNTYIGAWDINHKIFGYRHVLAYQNRVQNLDSGPNCMLLHIQSKRAILPEWIVDTSGSQNFLMDLYDLADPIIDDISNLGLMSLPSERNNYVVERGVYHIAILNNLSKEALKETLSQIPKSKLPLLKKELIDFFSIQFNSFPLLLCCFDNKEAKQASPILVHYPPIHPNTFMLNTIDAHGGIPEINKRILFHQKLIIGSYKSNNNSDEIKPLTIPEDFYPSLKEYLPKYIYATDLWQSFLGPNKDFCVSVNDIHQNATSPSISLEILGNRKSKTKIEVHRLGHLFRLRPPRKI